MTIQIVGVDDTAPGPTSDVGITTDGTTITNSKNWVNTGTMGITGDVAVNTDKFTVDAATGNIKVKGTTRLYSDFIFGYQGDDFTVYGGGIYEGAGHYINPDPITTPDLTSGIISFSAINTENVVLELPSPTYGLFGKKLTIYMIGTSTYDLIVTPDNFYDGTTYTLSSDGEYVNLVFLQVSWHLNGGTGTLA